MHRIISPKIAQKVMKLIFWISGIITILILLVIIGYVILKGMPVLNLEFYIW